jgi:hypothetical protein
MGDGFNVDAAIPEFDVKFFFPKARTQSSATTAESIPPLSPMTAPLRLKFLEVISRMKSEMREISEEGVILRIILEKFRLPTPACSSDI